MSTVVFNPQPNRLVPPVISEEVSVEAALKQDAMQKSSPWRMIFGLALMVLMVSVMIIIFTATGRFNLSGGGGAQALMPMMGMMMMASMLGMSIFQMVQGGLGGGDASEIDRNRITYAQMLSEKRKQTQAIARSMHQVAVFNNPNPENMPMMVRSRDRSMWQAVKGEDTAPGAGSEMSANPFMRARFGVGLIKLDPPIQTPPAAVMDNTEPVTAKLLTRFLAVQGVVPNAPLAWNLEAPGYGFRGDDREARLGVVRSMILSLAYNHSPTVLSLGVVTDRPEQWEWMKWLPHTQNRYVDPTNIGYPIMSWESMDDFTKDFSGFEKKFTGTDAEMVVVVDLPDSTVAFPALYPDGYPDTHLLIAGAMDDTKASEITTRFHIGRDGMFSGHGAIEIARADNTPLLLAEEVAREMSPLRPRGFEVIEGEETSREVSLGDLPDMYEVLGITDLERWDVRHEWAKTDRNASLAAPIGYKLNKHDRPTGEIVELDILQLAGGKGPDGKGENGTGPHGAFMGGTGTGKSFMLKLIILMMCAKHSPAKLNLILADFKGGSTFFELGKLPHVLASISNLEGAQDLVNRTEQVILGEIQRRQEVFSKYEAVDILDYRLRAADDPSMPPMPVLLFVADELAEFLKAHSEYVALFEQIGRVGRSLGVYMLIGSQVLEQSLLRTTVDHLTYGISLRVKSTSASRTILGTDEAVNLPPSKIALFKHSHLQDDFLDRFITFDHGQPYIRRRDIEEDAVPLVIDPEQDELLSTAIEPFTLMSSGSKPEIIEGEVILPSTDTDDGRDTAEDTGKTMFAALAEHILAQSEGVYDVYQMWLTSMKVPMTLVDVGSNTPPDPSKFTIRVGDIDDPYKHRRIPLETDFDSSQSATLILGDPGTGKTMTLAAYVGSSAQRYRGTDVSWYLYDYAGAALSMVETFPNVGAYITRSDEDGFGRLVGEVKRIIGIRQQIFNANRIVKVSDYLSRKAELLPNPGMDPYGRFMIGFDGFGQYIEDLGLEHPETFESWKTIIATGGRVGVHFVGTSTKTGGRMTKFTEQFGHFIQHSMADGMESSFRTSEARKAVTMIPAVEPGRLIDASMLDAANRPVILQARALVPITREIEPTRWQDKAPVYDRTDHSAAVRAQGEAFSASQPGLYPALPLTPVPEMVPYSMLVNGMDVASLRAPDPKDRELVVAIDRSTALRVTQKLSSYRHMVVAGDTQSGVTTTLRTYINAITQSYAPEEASIIILDGRTSLLGEVDYLVQRGYMRPESYAMNREKAVPIIKKLGKLLDSRKPGDDVTPRQIANRTFFKGKEIFVIIDGFDSLKARNSYSQEEGTLEWLAPFVGQQDMGVHFVVGSGAAQFTTNISGNKFLTPVTQDAPTRFILLSGPASAGVLWMGSGVRFIPSPAGRGRWVDAATPRDHTTVQIAYSESRGVN